MKFSEKKIPIAAKRLLLAILCLFAAFFAFLPFSNASDGGREAIFAKADSTPDIEVNRYTLHAVVKKNREIRMHEEITVRFLKGGFTMFYRSLPIDQGDQYFDITAECPGNAAFKYDVVTNPDSSAFLDVECIGNVSSGAQWTYYIDYTMITTSNEVENGMLLDVVGAGWPVALNNVSVTLEFPDALVDYNVYSGGFGASEGVDVTKTLSSDGKTLALYAEQLPLLYNDTYRESMAAAITLRFTLKEGVLKGYTASRIFTKNMGVVLAVCVLAFAAIVTGAFLFRKKRDIIPIVGLKAPQEMDPLKMGQLIDGRVDNEDITSMIYYFASKGHLAIDLENEKNPVLIRKKALPADAPAYQRVLFEGLFKSGEKVAVSSLAYHFYQSADQAKTLVSTKEFPYYEKRTEVWFGVSLAMSVLLFFLFPMFSALFRVGGGYSYFFGIFMALPLVFCWVFIRSLINLRFKSKSGAKAGLFIAVIALAVLSSCLFVFLCAKHLLNVYEKWMICFFAWGTLFAGGFTVSRSEKYNEILGEILGFKEFITVTSEEKIKFMLQDNPELFYDLLPYAQVLGVTKEWENKFKNILLQPPSWYVGSRMTVFDYVIIGQCMRRASSSMLSRPQSSSVGRSGGGGHFGGFSGGGHGGGGGGAR